MKLYKFHIPQEYIGKIDELVREGEYPNRSDFVTKAIKEKLEEEKEKEKKGGLRERHFTLLLSLPFTKILLRRRLKRACVRAVEVI